MRGLIEFFARAERGDDHRHLVLFAQRQILLEPVVRSMHDLIDRERRRRPLGMRLVVGGEFFLDPHQPFVEQRRRARVQRRKRSDDAGLALRDHQIGHGNDEQRRTDHGNRQSALEQGRHGHSGKSFGDSGGRRDAMRGRRCQTSCRQGNRAGRADHGSGLLAQRPGDVIVGPAVVRLSCPAGDQNLGGAGCGRIAVEALALFVAFALAERVGAELAVRRAVGRRPDISRARTPWRTAWPDATGRRKRRSPHPWRAYSNRPWSLADF